MKSNFIQIHAVTFTVIEFFPFGMSKRFKLLFLGENEEYLRDIGCSVETRLMRTENPGSDRLFCASLNRISQGGHYRGRLRIGTNSLFLDLEGIVWIR